MALGMGFSGFKTKLHEKEIEALLADRKVLDGMEETADEVERNVKARTSGSSTVRPFGQKMTKDRIRDGRRKVKIRVGTTWGPAVPVEYGGANTPPQRILQEAAERSGGRFEP